ncbi:MAG: ABC transporter ATP-binding protein [Actinomycetota bacterium]
MSFGPPAGSPFGGGPSASQVSAANGLPFAGMPSELAERAEKILATEPEHPTPDVAFHPRAQAEDRFTLRSFLAPHRWRLTVAVLLVVVETVAFQAGPLLIQIGLDRAIVPRRLEVLWWVAAAYLAAIGVNVVASRVRVLFTGQLGERLMYELRVKVFSHLQRQSLDFYTRNKLGVLMTRMTSDIDALSALFQDGLVNLAVQLLTLAVITVVLVILNPLLAAITLLAVVPAMAALTWWFRGASARTYATVRDRIAAVLSDLSESLAGMRIIVANNRRRHNVINHANIVGAHRDANIEASLVGP